MTSYIPSVKVICYVSLRDHVNEYEHLLICSCFHANIVCPACFTSFLFYDEPVPVSTRLSVPCGITSMARKGKTFLSQVLYEVKRPWGFWCFVLVYYTRTLTFRIFSFTGSYRSMCMMNFNKPSSLQLLRWATDEPEYIHETFSIKGVLCPPIFVLSAWWLNYHPPDGWLTVTSPVFKGNSIFQVILIWLGTPLLLICFGRTFVHS